MLFLFCEQNYIEQMPLTLECVQCMVTSVLGDQQYMFGVRGLLMLEKLQPMQPLQQSITSAG